MRWGGQWRGWCVYRLYSPPWHCHSLACWWCVDDVCWCIKESFGGLSASQSVAVLDSLTMSPLTVAAAVLLLATTGQYIPLISHISHVHMLFDCFCAISVCSHLLYCVLRETTISSLATAVVCVSVVNLSLQWASCQFSQSICQCVWCVAVVYGEELERTVCTCQSNFLPVCARTTRGRAKTYSNLCQAECALVTVAPRSADSSLCCIVRVVTVNGHS